MKSIAPNIFVKDIAGTIAFYELLGFSVAVAVPEESDPVWVMMTCGEVNFMFQTFDDLGAELPAISRRSGGSLLLYIQIDRIREFHERIKDHVPVVKGLEKAFYGATEFSIVDPNGYILTFAEDE